MPQNEAELCQANIRAGAEAVEVTVLSGHSQITMFGLTIQLPDSVVVDEGDGKIGRIYVIDDPDALIANRKRITCHGRVFKTHGDRFRVVCRIAQGGREVCTCGVEGTFEGETVAFRIACLFV